MAVRWTIFLTFFANHIRSKKTVPGNVFYESVDRINILILFELSESGEKSVAAGGSSHRLL